MHLFSSAMFVAVVVLAGARPAFALPPPIPTTYEGFLHAGDQHPSEPEQVIALPSNAKGVLYLAVIPETLLFEVDRDARDVVLRSMPRPLSPRAFTITGGPKGTPRKAVLTRLDSGPAEPRYWLARGKLQSCLKRQARAGCGGLLDIMDWPEWIARSKAQGLLVGIDAQARAASGLFRVAPEGGWKPGELFHVRIKRTVPTEPPYFVLPDRMAVRIDAAPLDAAGSKFSLASVGGPVRYFSIPDWGRGSGITQEFKFQVPAPYQRHADKLVFFTEKLPHGAAQALPPDADYDRHDRTRGRGSVSLPCDLRAQPLVTHRIRGYAGFLEVEDRLAETEVLAMTLGGPGSGCDAVVLLDDALKTRNVQRIRDMSCSLHSVPSALISDPGRYARSLAALASGSEQATRTCALSALANHAVRNDNGNADEKIDRAAIKAAVALTAAALGDANARVRQGGAGAVQLLVYGMGTSSERFGPEVMRPAVLPFIHYLLDARTPHEERTTLMLVLHYLGPAGRSALPALLAAAQGPDQRRALAAIDALMAFLGNEPEVVSVILARLADTPDMRAALIRHLSTLGERGRGALPLLRQLIAANALSVEAMDALLMAADGIALPKSDQAIVRARLRKK